MVSFLLLWGGKLLARPTVLVGLISSLALGGMALKAKMVSGRHAKEVAALNQTIATRDATIANLHISIGQERLNVNTLTGRLREQNAAILQMQAAAKVAQASATLAVRDALEKGRADAANRLQPSPSVPPGFESLNAEAAKLWSRP